MPIDEVQCVSCSRGAAQDTDGTDGSAKQQTARHRPVLHPQVLNPCPSLDHLQPLLTQNPPLARASTKPSIPKVGAVLPHTLPPPAHAAPAHTVAPASSSSGPSLPEVLHSLRQLLSAVSSQHHHGHGIHSPHPGAPQTKMSPMSRCSAEQCHCPLPATTTPLAH